MSTIKNSKGETFDVSDVDAVNMVKADPSLSIVGDVATSNQSGDAPVSVAGGQALTQEGVSAASAQEQAAAAHKEYLAGKTSTLGSFARGGLNMVTGGLTGHFFGDEINEADQAHHGTANLVGAGLGLAATVGLGADLGIGRALESDAGRALAASSDALTAEHVAGGLPSKALLGVESETKAGRALGRAGGAIDDGAALRSIPEDLAGMDAKQLGEAASIERKAIAASKEAEIARLQEERIPLRRQAADDVRSLHDDLSNAGERPIYNAISTENLKSVLPELKGVKGVQTAQVALADSFKTMRRQLRNSVAVADDPGQLVKTLQMRQGALETLQAKMPEILEAKGGDAGALVHVDDALAQTKEQIARVQSLGRNAPVSSPMLTDLKAGVSPRLTAIENAKAALEAVPPESGIAKMLGHEAYGKATALMHMIPGAGIVAPFVGKYAADMVGRLFSRLGEHGAASAASSADAVKALLATGGRAVAKAAPMTATRVLASAKFGAGEDTGKSLPELFKARSAEIRSQTMYAPDGSVQMRPDARMEMSKRLDPIASVNPLLADKLESIGARKIAFISSKIPRKPDDPSMQFGPDKWMPSDLQIRSWARTVRAVEDPASVERDLASGKMTPEAAEAYRTVYPERFAALVQSVQQQAPQLAKTLPMDRKIALSIFTGVPLIPELQPNVLAVLQSNFAAEPGSMGGSQAPKPMPSFGALGSPKSLDKPTPAQQRGG